MRRTKQIFSTLQKQNKRIPSSMIDSLVGEEMQESDVTAESKVESRIRQIIREELNGLCATLEEDPLVRAIETVDRLDVVISGNDVNINEVKKCVKRLKTLLPDISEEIEIIRDTLVGV